jgi:hypothetical protein
MAYTNIDFKTKKALKEAVARGDNVTVFQPNQMFASQTPPKNGTVSLEGPHYPKPHTWYARAEMKNGVVVKVS